MQAKHAGVTRRAPASAGGLARQGAQNEAKRGGQAGRARKWGMGHVVWGMLKVQGTLGAVYAALAIPVSYHRAPEQGAEAKAQLRCRWGSHAGKTCGTAAFSWGGGI